jgi:hypothetical protein
VQGPAHAVGADVVVAGQRAVLGRADHEVPPGPGQRVDELDRVRPAVGHVDHQAPGRRVPAAPGDPARPQAALAAGVGPLGGPGLAGGHVPPRVQDLVEQPEHAAGRGDGQRVVAQQPAARPVADPPQVARQRGAARRS